MTSRVASNIDDPDLKDRHKELLTNIWLRGSSTSYSPPMGVASSASSSPREPHQTSAEVLLKMEGKSYDSDDNMFDPFSRDMVELMEKCKQLEVTLADRDATIVDLQQRLGNAKSSSSAVTVEDNCVFFAKPEEEGDVTSNNAALIQRLQNQLMKEVIYCTKLEAFCETAKNDMTLAQIKIDTLAEEVYTLREVLLQGREMGLPLEETKDKAIEAIKKLFSPLASPPMSARTCTEDCVSASRLLMEQEGAIQDLEREKSHLESELDQYREECKSLKKIVKDANDAKMSKTTELTNELIELRFQNISSKDEVSRLQAKCSDALKAESNAIKKVEELDAALVQLKNLAENLQEESKAKSDHLLVQRKSIERLELEVNEIKEEKAKSTQQFESEMHLLHTDQAEKSALLKKRDEELEVLQAELQIRMADVERLTAGLSFSSEEVKTISEQMNNLKQSFDIKDEELSLIRRELLELIEKYSNQDKNELKDKKLESDVSILMELKNVLSQHNAKSTHLIEEVNAVQDELNGLRVEKVSAIEEGVLLKKSLKECMEEQNKLKADAVAALEKLKKSELMVKTLESKIEELSKLEDSNINLKTKNDKLNSEVEKLQTSSSIEKAEGIQQINSLEEQLKTSMEENKRLNLLVADLQVNIDALNQNAKEKEAELIEISSKLDSLPSESPGVQMVVDDNGTSRDVNSSILSIDEIFEYEVSKQDLLESKNSIAFLNEQLAEKNNELEEKNREVKQLRSKLGGIQVESTHLKSPSKIDIQHMKTLPQVEDKCTSVTNGDFDNYNEKEDRRSLTSLSEVEVREREANLKIISLQTDLDILKKAFEENMQKAQTGTPMAQQDRILRLEESVESKNEEILELRTQLESIQRALNQSKEAYSRLAKFKTDLHNKSDDTKSYSENEQVFLTTVFLECREMFDSWESVFDSEVASMNKFVDSMKSVDDPTGEFLQIRYDGLMDEITTMLAALASTKESITRYGEYIQQKILDAAQNSPPLT